MDSQNGGDSGSSGCEDDGDWAVRGHDRLEHRLGQRGAEGERKVLHDLQIQEEQKEVVSPSSEITWALLATR